MCFRGRASGSEEQRSDKERGKGASDVASEATSGSHMTRTQTRMSGSLIGRYALAWELGQALDHLCADKSAPAEDLESMIAAAQTAGVMESTIQAAMAEAAQRRSSRFRNPQIYADAPRNQIRKLV